MTSLPESLSGVCRQGGLHSRFGGKILSVKTMTHLNDWIRRHPARRLGSCAAFCVVITCIVCCMACSKSPEQGKTSELKPVTVTTSPAPQFSPLAQVTPSATQTKSAFAPPRTEEVVAAVSRVFDKSAKLEQSGTPAFVVGDFNGDGSEDIAVVIKPSEGSLADINSGVANWILEDPHDVQIPGTKAADQLVKPKPVKAEKNELLLAIIHGLGPQGWRDTQARQTLLLRNAAGVNGVLQAPSSASAKEKLPPLKGDAIIEVVNGHRGLIFWTGAKYAWAPQD